MGAAIALWFGIAALLVVGLLSALGGLNQSLYGAGSFVLRYLEAVADDDIVAASTVPGVALDAEQLDKLGLPADISTAMMRADTITAAPEDIQIVSDIANDNGSHTVTASYRIDTDILSSTFEVRPMEPLYGVLHRWQFAVSPLGVLEVTAENNPLFTVGSLTLDTRANASDDEIGNFTQTTPYLVIAPAVYELDYTSTLLVAPTVTAVAEPTSPTDVTIAAIPTDEFVARVQTKVDEYLDACAAQPVLQPADCPFGFEIYDRIIGDPVWSIAVYPTVTLVAGDDAFEMPPTEGVAHLTVEVQSLFDGSFSTQEEDVVYRVSLTASIKPDGSISIQLR